MTYSMIGQQRYSFQDHQGRHTLLFMTYSGNAEIWQSDRHLSDLYGIQKLRSTLESFVGTSATLVGIKDATSFVRGCLLFAQMYYVEQFLYIEQYVSFGYQLQSISSVGLWLALRTTMEIGWEQIVLCRT